VDYVYWWSDGIWFNVRLPDADGNQDRLCCLVIIGVRPDGRKELVAVADGYRESTDSWADLLRDLRDRGLRAPELATDDGAPGFWAALRDVFDGKAREQRCWVHKKAKRARRLALETPPRSQEDDPRHLSCRHSRGCSLARVADFADTF